MTAQAATAWIDAAASSARPPAGVIGTTTLYGLLGARARVDTRSAGGFGVYLRGGRGGGPSPANWAEGEATWEIGGAGDLLAWGGRADLFGLDYTQPFDYRALGARLEPRLSSTIGGNVLTLRGDLRRGRWHLAGPDTAVDTLRSGRLALSGGSATVGRSVGPAWVEAGAESYHGALDGWFTGAVATASLSRRALDVGLLARAWSTPLGSELGLAASLGLTAGDAATVRLEVGRSVTDPLYGTPGSLGASIGVSLRIGTVQSRARGPRVVELTGTDAQTGHRARFTLHAPRAHAVAVAGDFTDWRPRPMTRTGDDWVLELPVPPGVHHFAFLIDSRDWRVPADAPGVSSDEWGRKNATLVVEP